MPIVISGPITTFYVIKVLFHLCINDLIDSNVNMFDRLETESPPVNKLTNQNNVCVCVIHKYLIYFDNNTLLRK